MSAGAFFVQKKGFTVVLQDTADLRFFSERNHFPGGKWPVHSGKTGGGKSAKTGQSVGGSQSLPGGGSPPAYYIHSHAYRVSFVNANDDVEIVPDKPLSTYNNYIIGKDPSKWAGNCKIYQGLMYKNIYPGVDLHYYSESGLMKYEMIVHPGADPNQIALKYEGQDQLKIKKGQVVVSTSVSEVKELAPYSYQPNDAGKKEVDCKYVLEGNNTIRFKVRNYSPDSTLVIDPTIVFCSFTGSTADNWGFTATYGPDGSMYVSGIVAGPGWPVSLGAYQPTSNAHNFAEQNYWDVGVMKFNPNGTTRVYGTYLGGSRDEYPHSLVVDNNGELVVMGRTYSSDFPVYPTGNTFGSLGGSDIFITKLNAAGTFPIGSMKIGGSGDDGVNIADQGELSIYTAPGSADPEHLQSLIRNYGDWSRNEVILDGAGNIYAAACTQSMGTAANGGFPIVGSVFQPTSGGGIQDGVVLKINPACNNIIFSSFLGGSLEDAALVMDLNPLTNDIYVGGSTVSTNFPGVTTGTPVQGTFRGTIDGVVSVISNDGKTLKGSTYLSSPSAGTIDMIYGVKFDKQGFPYVVGTSTGSWQATPNVTYSNAGAKQFVVKLQPDLSGIVYTTTFGSTNATKPNISPVAFLVDRCGNVYVSGWGGWYGAVGDPYDLQGTMGMPVTPDAVKSYTDNRDFYFIVLQRNSSKLLYGTFFGETDDMNSISEHVDGGTSRFDKNGVIYQAICANCYRGNQYASDYLPFPTTLGVWSPHNGAGDNGCNLAALKIAFNFSGVSAGLKVTLAGRGDSLGCIPLNALLQDTVRNAKSYIWNFGDGSAPLATTNYAESHTYNNVGEYTVTLIAIDSTSCNISDTATVNIYARNNPATLDFKWDKVGPCTSTEFQFINLSTTPATSKPFTGQPFAWDFGDNSPEVPAAVTDSVIHNFQSSGTYNVSLILTDTSYCNYPDTLTKPLYIAQNVKAQFVTPAHGCAPYTAIINNTSIAGQQFYWSFGDGTFDTTDRTPPPHLYPNVGTYTIKLVVIDSATCNIIDSTEQTITVDGKPTAMFSFTPYPPVANTPDIFTNQSTNGGVKFEWIFGDGDTAFRTTMDTVMHQYNSTDTFQVCLVAFNQYGCSDTVCKPVAVLINPLLDVPNAFTPGRFGQNAIVKVVGFGITKMIWRIYNRWGQLMFQSNDPNIGWDGTYGGKIQAMDVYAYTLEAEFFNGAHVAKKGDITLIR